MIVTRIRLAGLRAIEAAELRFRPGVNLIVGVNGVGKTSVLDALGVCLSAIVKQANKLRGRAETFSASDIRIGSKVMDAECDVLLGKRSYNYLVHKPRESSVPRKKKAGLPREQVDHTPARAEFVGDRPVPLLGNESGGRPLAVLFSTRRAVPSQRVPSKAASEGGIAGAFAEAFTNRELRLSEFAVWMKAQEALVGERPQVARVLDACEEAVRRFLPGYSNLRQRGAPRSQLLIDREGTALPVRQLSEGERGSLSLVLDLTRRLAQANPELGAPALEAEAVVLIDEIDLHLHPKWQRQIVLNLTAAFPRCQFIATTHSPQIIGEVPHERIQIMAHGQVYSPAHSFGVDSSRVLEEVMEAAPRSGSVQKLLEKISRALGRQQFEQSRELLRALIEQIGEADPEVTRLRTLLDFVEGRE